MRNRTLQIILTLVIPIVLISGCSTPKSVALTTENRNSIKSVHIDKNVSKPNTIFWRGSSQAWGAALFGVLGAVATSDAAMTDAERMVKFMDEKHIDISEIVYSEVSNQMSALKTFNISDADKTDATLNFSVDMYGFNKTHPFGSNMNPVIRMTGKLIKADHEIIWQESEHVSDFASDNDQGQSLDTYQNEPAKLRAALAKASKVAVNRLLAKLP
jgi:hypothetical protein